MLLQVIYDLDKQSNIYKEFNTRKLLKRGGGTSDDVVERPVKQQKLGKINIKLTLSKDYESTLLIHYHQITEY